MSYDCYIRGQCELVCEICAAGNEESCGSVESDSPLMCAECHRPLNCSLTSDGITCLSEMVDRDLCGGISEYARVYAGYDGTYFEDSPHCAIVETMVSEFAPFDARLKRKVAWMTRRAALMQKGGAR